MLAKTLLTRDNWAARSGADRNRVGSRERSALAWPPHSMSRCSRVGRSPNFVTRVIRAIVISLPGLSQPGSTSPCCSGTPRCSRHTRPPQLGYDAGKRLTDWAQHRNAIGGEDFFHQVACGRITRNSAAGDNLCRPRAERITRRPRSAATFSKPGAKGDQLSPVRCNFQLFVPSSVGVSASLQRFGDP
jgi:hypothetical protein